MLLTLTENHKYLRPDGTPFPGVSVTEAIKGAGMMGYLPNDHWYLDRGTYVHQAIQMHFAGTLNYEDLDTVLRPYVDSALEYVTAKGIVPRETEISMGDEIYCYAGTADAVPLLDWKTGSSQDWHSIQMALYWYLCKVNNLGDEMPLTIHLSPNGKLPKVEQYSRKQLQDALKLGLAAVAIGNWKKTYLREVI